jgi:hypothetical protein
MQGFTHESTKNETVEWYTPPSIFELLRFPEFDLDPCSPGINKCWVPAKKCYTKQDDGLKQQWNGRVFLNPPYGKETPDWLEKLRKHGNGIALVFSRTDTEWFHMIAAKADAIAFLIGRVKFMRYDGTVGKQPGCGSMLLAYGNECADILVNAGIGYTIDNRRGTLNA